MKTMPSSALCAHLHDTFCHGADSEYVDALVSAIVSSTRTIEVCKELAYLCKSVIGNNEVDFTLLHHLPLKTRNGVVISDHMGVPHLKGKSFELVNRLIHSPQSGERDKTLALLTKLHGYVLPLELREATRKTNDIFKNIISPREIDSSVIDEFRHYVRGHLLARFGATKTVTGESIRKYDCRWWNHLEPLHNLAVKYHTSTKKRPKMNYDESSSTFTYDETSLMNDVEGYVLTSILTNSHVRLLYLRHKEEFLTLVTGLPVSEVIDDEYLLSRHEVDAPIGRTGIRLQEAEKIRLLWMNLAVFECLTQPAVDALEFLVRTSKNQTAYLDDEQSSLCIQNRYFTSGVSSQMIYSIDQSSFTDNFPYRLQRVVLEEMYRLGIIPITSLESFDLQVKGPYRPAQFFTNWDARVSFANGTPMGAYGCWMLSTISHELLIEMIQDKLGHPHDEFVQGDDAVFSGTDVYNLYLEYFERINVSVNQQKTLISDRAIEYCGWIITAEMTCPMFRPHDRLHDHPLDVVSPRALKAFGVDRLSDWIRQNRPEILAFLQIQGLIPISEDDDTLAAARIIFSTTQKAQEIVHDGMTPSQRSLMYKIQEFYPQVEYDYQMLSSMKTSQVLPPSSDIDVYQMKYSHLKYLMRQLRSNAYVDIEYICQRIIVLCDDIWEHHKDRIEVVRSNSHVTSDPRERSIPSFLRDKNRDATLIKQTEKCLKIAQDNLKRLVPST